MEKYVVGVGGANLDMHARSRNPVVMRDSNPSYMHTSAGGVTRNIIENLAVRALTASCSPRWGTTPSGTGSCAPAARRGWT